MKFTKTIIRGLYVIEPDLKKDIRGYFTRLFCQKELRNQGLSFDIVQINRSLTKKKGSIRGLHFQKDPYAEGKIVQCVQGTVFEVAVDIRKKSPTYSQWFSVELSDSNLKMLYVPKGFALGFQALTSNVILQYAVSQYYTPAFESGIRFDDPFCNIKWPLKPTVLSEKDKNRPFITKETEKEYKLSGT